MAHLRAARLLIALAAALLALSPGAARADEGWDDYAAARAKLDRPAARLVWEAADAARKMGLHAHARAQAERALSLDPDLKPARELLGFAKRRGKWVHDPGEDDAPRENVAPRGQQVADVERAWREERLRRAEAGIAALHAKLGAECRAKGHEAPARRAFEEALRLDPDCAPARRALGHVRLGEVWLTPDQQSARERAARGEIVRAAGEWEGLLSRPVARAHAAHFAVEGTCGERAALESLGAVESLYAFYLADLGLDPTADVLPARATFLLVDTQADWQRVLDRREVSNQEFVRPQHWWRTSPLFYGFMAQPGCTGEERTDHLVHNAVHVMNHHVFRISERAWIDEALAYHFTIRLLGSELSYCVALRETDYAQAGAHDPKHWTEAGNWRGRVKELVLRKDDVPLRTIVNQRLEELAFPSSLKAWSVVDWLRGRDVEDFRALLGRLGPEQDQAAALEAHFGRGVEAVDDEWRAWVRRAY